MSILLMLLVAGWAYTSGIERLADIALYDETYYLLNGLDLPNAGLPPADGYPRGAPLYAVWYWLLSLFRNDTIQLYYLNCKATAVLPSLGCYLFMRCCRAGRIASTLVSLVLLFVVANIDVWPRISHFALTVILCGLALASRTKSPETRLSICAVTALLSSYTRPEFFLAFLCLLIVWAGLIGWRFRHLRVKPLLVPLLVTVVVCGVLLVGVGVPLGSSGRSWFAFQQHYALNASHWAPSDVNPWTNHRLFVESAFPHAQSIFGALRENPAAFGKHVLANLIGLPVAAKNLLLEPYRTSTLPASTLKVTLLALAILGLATLSLRPFSRMLVQTWSRAKKSLLSICAALLLLLPPVLSAVAIFPRPHYLLFLLLLPVGLVSIFSRSLSSTHRGALASVVIICVVLLFISRPSGQRSLPQPNLAVIQTLRSLAIHRPVNLLEAEGGYGVYVGRNYNRIAEYEKQSGFYAFMREKTINMIVLSGGLKTDSRFRDDPEWQAFVADPSSRGFRPIPVPGVPDRFVMVKEDLSGKPPSCKGDK